MKVVCFSTLKVSSPLFSDVSFGETLSGYVYKYKECCEASGPTFKTGRVETHQIVKRVRVREIDLLEYL